jgi:hypothetical protein
VRVGCGGARTGPLAKRGGSGGFLLEVYSVLRTLSMHTYLKGLTDPRSTVLLSPAMCTTTRTNIDLGTSTGSRPSYTLLVSDLAHLGYQGGSVKGNSDLRYYEPCLFNLNSRSKVRLSAGFRMSIAARCSETREDRDGPVCLIWKFLLRPTLERREERRAEFTRKDIDSA